MAATTCLIMIATLVYGMGWFFLSCLNSWPPSATYKII
jgi:hypothetical protein